MATDIMNLDALLENIEENFSPDFTGEWQLSGFYNSIDARRPSLTLTLSREITEEHKTEKSTATIESSTHFAIEYPIPKTLEDLAESITDFGEHLEGIGIKDLELGASAYEDDEDDEDDEDLNPYIEVCLGRRDACFEASGECTGSGTCLF